MIIRIVITLIIAMIFCFAFQQHLMRILLHPVEKVWTTHVENQLPTKKEAPRALDFDTWEKAKQIEHAASTLQGEDRTAFFESLNDPSLVFHARSVELFRAAKALPKEKQAHFLNRQSISKEMKDQVAALLIKEPNPETDSRGNLMKMSALKPTETFMLSMKLSFFAGIIVSFPLLLMFLLQFILPGLHGNERRVLWPSLAIGFGLFLTGVLFAYFAVLPRALGFFFEWGGSLGVSNDWRIGEYITFATQFTLLFGLSFELPVVVMVIVKLGLLSYATMASTRRYAIVAIFVVAAVLTPTPDALTLTLMAGPMIVLYEICIWLAWFSERQDAKRESEEAQQRMEGLLNGTYEPKPSEVEEADAARVAEETHESKDDGWDEETPENEDLPEPPSHENPESGERDRHDP